MRGNILITGGAGFLGRAIIRRAIREKWEARFTVYSRDENKQFEVKRRYGKDADLRFVLGDVIDAGRLRDVMTGHDIVIHAAAVKFIPEAEWNVREAIRVNVEGSNAVAEAAVRAGVETVIGISTDKACAPLNTYGATKMLMERIFSEWARIQSRTHFATVRYGNVIGSTGSVIPLFEKQMADRGELQVTDPRMTRFWLSADAAVDLILLALGYAEGRPGATLIGANPAMAITELATAVWRLYLAEHGGSLTGAFEKVTSSKRKLRLAARESLPKLRFTGIRPGEKLAEQLFNEQEAPRAYPIFESEATRGFVLLPPTERLGDGPGDPLPAKNGYSSDAPVRWLSTDEMIDLIIDARTI